MFLDMSRHITNIDNFEIAYGYDHMGMWPGYFFEVWDTNQKSEEEPDGKLIVNEGMVKGISQSRMLELMTQYKVSNKEHLHMVSGDLPI